MKKTAKKRTTSKSLLKSRLKKQGLKLPHGYEIAIRKKRTKRKKR